MYARCVGKTQLLGSLRPERGIAIISRRGISEAAMGELGVCTMVIALLACLVRKAVLRSSTKQLG